MLGLILGMSGGGSGGAAASLGDSFSYGGKTYETVLSLGTLTKAHSGEDIGVSAPKMHSGGNVMAGRIGLVPALKDDEVLRTCRWVRKSTVFVTAAATKFWQLLPCGRWIIQPKRRHRSLLRRSIPAALPNT